MATTPLLVKCSRSWWHVNYMSGSLISFFQNRSRFPSTMLLTGTIFSHFVSKLRLYGFKLTVSRASEGFFPGSSQKLCFPESCQPWSNFVLLTLKLKEKRFSTKTLTTKYQILKYLPSSSHGQHSDKLLHRLDQKSMTILVFVPSFFVMTSVRKKTRKRKHPRRSLPCKNGLLCLQSASDVVLNSMCLQLLLPKPPPPAQASLAIIDHMMMEVLLKQLVELGKPTGDECMPLQWYKKKLVSHVALDLVLDDLCQELDKFGESDVD